jgi:hypothetical protein
MGKERDMEGRDKSKTELKERKKGVKNNNKKYIIFTETAPLHAIKNHDQLTEYPIILQFISEHPEKCQDSIHQTCHHSFISHNSIQFNSIRIYLHANLTARWPITK